jgi:hypothetical protein
VDPIPHPLLLRKSCGAGNGTRVSGSVGRNSDLYTTEAAQNSKQMVLLPGNFMTVPCELKRSDSGQ